MTHGEPTDRPPKLPPSALLVFWGSKMLTMCEKVVTYHDWTLDQGGLDGAYISPASLSRRVGGEYAPSTIAQARGHLRRLTLRLALTRRDARNLGWVVTLPDACRPHSAREAEGMAAVLDRYITQREEWLARQRPPGADTNGQPSVSATASRAAGATALGGRGGDSLLASECEAQLASVVSSGEKGVGAHAPESREERRDPRIVRAEGMALIRLQQGKSLTPEEQQLVREYLKRHPDHRVSA